MKAYKILSALVKQLPSLDLIRFSEDDDQKSFIKYMFGEDAKLLFGKWEKNTTYLYIFKRNDLDIVFTKSLLKYDLMVETDSGEIVYLYKIKA